MEKQSSGRVLVVEDDVAARHGLVAVLRARRYEVLEAESCEGALRLVESRPDIVITDLRLPDGDAVSLLPRLRAIDPTVPVYIVTGFATIDVAVRAVKLGAEDMFTKPVEMATVLACVDKAVARRRVTQTEKLRRVRFDTFQPKSDVMRRLDEEVERLRDSDCTVLLVGEGGTGKSIIARRLHDIGARAAGPFVEVDCTGAARELLESRLFGLEADANTGSHPRNRGLFGAANGGTLFFDEVAAVDLQLQPKLMEVLEEKRYRPVGDVGEHDADVRLIGATRQDLVAAVAQKTFRADLFYRISTVTLQVPPLRERSEDIAPLVEHVLSQEQVPHVRLTPEAWEKIASYPWPGNLRELNSVVQRALVLRQDDVIAAENVRFDVEARPSITSRAPSAPPDRPAARTLEELEREHIARALDAESGRVKDAARRLGVPRSTLYQKIKNYGIALPLRTRASSPPTNENENERGGD